MADQQGSAALGCVALVGVFGIASCMFGGGDKTSDKASAAPVTASAPASETGGERLAENERKPAQPSSGINDEPLVQGLTALSLRQGGSGDGIAAALNLNGELCAKTYSADAVRGHRHQYDVVCVETDGSPRLVRYRFNAKTGQARLTGRFAT